MRFTARPLALLIILLCCFACTTIDKDLRAEPGSTARAEDEEVAKPLQITLSDGNQPDSAVDQQSRVEGKPLSQARIEKLLEMFTGPLEEQKDRPEFLKRPSSKPAPRSATPKEIPFPPVGAGSAPPDVKAQELEVLSVAPEGALARAPRLSISLTTL